MRPFRLRAAALMAVLLAIPSPAAATHREGDLRGRVITSAGAPLAGACVLAYLGDAQDRTAWTHTLSDGTFEMLWLAEGSYSLFIAACTAGRYENAWYESGLTREEATPVIIESDGSTTVTMTLFPAMSSISGQLRDGDGKVYPGADVVLHEERRGPISIGGSNADGFYRFDDLPAGRYFLHLRECWSSCHPQWYSGKASAEEADRVVLDGVTPVEGIDFLVEKVIPPVPDASLRLSVTEQGPTASTVRADLASIGTAPTSGGWVVMELCPKSAVECRQRLFKILPMDPGAVHAVEWKVGLPNEGFIGDATVTAVIRTSGDSDVSNDSGSVEIWQGVAGLGDGFWLWI